MGKDSSTLQSLREFIAHIPLTDTHEHIGSEKEMILKRPCVSHFFSHYASCDLVSAGMPGADLTAIRGDKLSDDEKWEKLEPYWLKARNTTYCRAIDMAIRDLFDLPGLSRETHKPLLEKMKQSWQPGWYHKVLKEKANIEVSVIDNGGADVDRTLFAPVVRFDEFVHATHRGAVNSIAEKHGVSIYSVSDLLSALDKAYERANEDGIVGVKCGLAYSRTLFFDNATQHEAETVFNRAFRERGEGVSWVEAKPFQDFIVHQIIRRADAYGLPVQFHTGIQEGNGNYVADTNPTLLTNLFLMYYRVKFDLFHAGFPYSREMSVLAKNFANVYPDMSWMHVIGAQPARNILDEWLDLVPANKILGFGGDYLFVEGAYGHACIARENVARVLADKVERGDQTLGEAENIAERILRLNGRELFKLDEKNFPTKS
jgi:uncharacterized protein